MAVVVLMLVAFLLALIVALTSAVFFVGAVMAISMLVATTINTLRGTRIGRSLSGAAVAISRLAATPVRKLRESFVGRFFSRVSKVVHTLVARFRRWAGNRDARAAGFFVSAIAVVVFLVLLRDSTPLHDLPGKTFSELTPTPNPWDLPDEPRKFIYYDYALMTSVAMALMFGMSLPADIGLNQQFRALRNPSIVWRSARGRLLLVGGVATVGYFISDAVETAMLCRIVADDPANFPSGLKSSDVREMANAHNAKWLFLALATVVMISVWTRRTPPRPGQSPVKFGVPADWHGPATLPPTNSGPDWTPSTDRFGVSVSGGGIRSASFAFGVLEVLRERGLLKEARYVASVSGGSYATSALEFANRTGTGAQKSLHRFRRRLNYLLTDTNKSIGAVIRLLLGVMINLWILYLVIFIVARPVGWLIGSPSVQEGLRYDGPVVTEIFVDESDPDVIDVEEAWNDPQKCGLDNAPNGVPKVFQSGPTVFAGQNGQLARIPFKIVVPTQCVQVDVPGAESSYWTFNVGSTTEAAGLITVEDGVATVTRQPVLTPTEKKINYANRCALSNDENLATLAALIDIEVPDLETKAEALVAPDLASARSLLDAVKPVEVTPKSVVDLRGDIDIDTRHWLTPVVIAVVAVLAWGIGGLAGVRRWIEKRREKNEPPWVEKVPGLIGVVLLGSATLLLALPALVKAVPESIVGGLANGPDPDLTSGLSWWPQSLAPLYAWPVLAVATVVRFIGQRRAAAASASESASKKRNAVALATKITSFLVRLAVGVVLIMLVIGSSITMMTTAAMNGPFGNNPWISNDVFGLGFEWPPDLVVWTVVVTALLVLRTVFSAGSWSLGSYYRSRLQWAFMGDDHSGQLVDVDGTNPRAGFLVGTNAELVICCAANIGGPDRAPAGRRAVSFSASRSWIGGPELGWVNTSQYMRRMGENRRQDLSIGALTALSGAAASPAMGKSSLGPIGSVLAIMNVRLGGWLPHPQAVLNIGSNPPVWQHTPGWPYFVREVLRSHKHESPYVYVSDGGHWENLGLVEILRRGCNHIVAVSASGDGAYSHATLAEAIEIARTDLNIEIKIDSVWSMRPPTGGDTDEFLGSKRQFVRQNGDEPELGRVAPIGWTFGTFTRLDVPKCRNKGTILLIEATMTDCLPVDVHAYAEAHHEFPDINTGDQFFTNRDFESYRMLGQTLSRAALKSKEGKALVKRVVPRTTSSVAWLLSNSGPPD